MLGDEYAAVAKKLENAGKTRRCDRRDRGLLHGRQTLTASGPQLDPRQPVAMFDSGVGGLTVLHECLVSLPEEDFVYLGDTAMFPTGRAIPTASASASATSPGCCWIAARSCW